MSAEQARAAVGVAPFVIGDGDVAGVGGIGRLGVAFEQPKETARIRECRLTREVLQVSDRTCAQLSGLEHNDEPHWSDGCGYEWFGSRDEGHVEKFKAELEGAMCNKAVGKGYIIKGYAANVRGGRSCESGAIIDEILFLVKNARWCRRIGISHKVEPDESQCEFHQQRAHHGRNGATHGSTPRRPTYSQNKRCG